jgi:hypothetical protein
MEQYSNTSFLHNRKIIRNYYFLNNTKNHQIAKNESNKMGERCTDIKHVQPKY